VIDYVDRLTVVVVSSSTHISSVMAGYLANRIINDIVENTVLSALTCEGYISNVSEHEAGAVV
jgi:hypothetical protein